MDLIAVRKALTSLRKLHWKNSRLAARAVGLGASTVAKVENVKGFADYDPGIGIIAKIVEGIPVTPRLTVSSFFAQLETGHASSTAIPDADPISKETTAIQALVNANTRIAESLEEIAAAAAVAAKPRRQTARSRTRKSSPSKVRRKAG